MNDNKENENNITEKILNSIVNTQHSAFFSLFLKYNCSMESILNIKKEDININNYEIYLYNKTITTDPEIIKLLMVLTQYKKQHEYIFTTIDNVKIQERTMKKTFSNYLKKTGINSYEHFIA